MNDLTGRANDLPDITDIRRDNWTIARQRLEDNRWTTFAPRTENKHISRRNQRHHVLGIAHHSDAWERSDGARHSRINGSRGLSPYQEYDQSWHLLRGCLNGVQEAHRVFGCPEVADIDHNRSVRSDSQLGSRFSAPCRNLFNGGNNHPIGNHHGTPWREAQPKQRVKRSLTIRDHHIASRTHPLSRHECHTLRQSYHARPTIVSNPPNEPTGSRSTLDGSCGGRDHTPMVHPSMEDV
jgi:hypothetical protein